MKKPDLKNLDGVVHPNIIDAMHKASEQLALAGVPHALIGGLAVGVHGYPRTTKDVDFLVGEEAFEGNSSGVVMFVSGVPINVRGVPVDSIPIADGEEHLKWALRLPDKGGIPTVSIGPLVYLKLKVGRRKDVSDVIELVAAGVDVDAVSKYLKDNAPEYLDMFLTLVKEVDS